MKFMKKEETEGKEGKRRNKCQKWERSSQRHTQKVQDSQEEVFTLVSSDYLFCSPKRVSLFRRSKKKKNHELRVNCLSRLHQ